MPTTPDSPRFSRLRQVQFFSAAYEISYVNITTIFQMQNNTYLRNSFYIHHERLNTSKFVINRKSRSKRSRNFSHRPDTACSQNEEIGMKREEKNSVSRCLHTFAFENRYRYPRGPACACSGEQPRARLVSEIFPVQRLTYTSPGSLIDHRRRQVSGYRCDARQDHYLESAVQMGIRPGWDMPDDGRSIRMKGSPLQCFIKELFQICFS